MQLSNMLTQLRKDLDHVKNCIKLLEQLERPEEEGRSRAAVSAAGVARPPTPRPEISLSTDQVSDEAPAVYSQAREFVNSV